MREFNLGPFWVLLAKHGRIWSVNLGWGEWGWGWQIEIEFGYWSRVRS